MTLEDFKDTYNRIFPYGDAMAISKHLFRVFDANKDGNHSFLAYSLIKITKKTCHAPDEISFFQIVGLRKLLAA